MVSFRSGMDILKNCSMFYIKLFLITQRTPSSIIILLRDLANLGLLFPVVKLACSGMEHLERVVIYIVNGWLFFRQ